MSTVDAVLSGNARWTMVRGDCLDVLRTLPDSCVDSLVTDPPSGIGFMGRSWDSDKGGRDAWIAWLAEIMREALRVLKPGAHILVWALPRTSHWTATAIEDAGFEIRDVKTHLFATGFPKSLNVSKAIDAAAGATREIVGSKIGRPGISKDGANQGNGFSRSLEGRSDLPGPTTDITAPATDEAREWDGWGTALKPAHEMWVLARKPIAALDYVANLQACLSNLAASIAAQRSRSSQVERSVAFASVLRSVERLSATRDDSSEATGMSLSELALDSSLSTVSSWLGILGEISILESTFITETRSSLTTDLRTLNCLASRLTPESIILAASNPSGLTSCVEDVGRLFADMQAKCAAIRTLFAIENATCDQDTQRGQASVSQTDDLACPTGHGSEHWILARKPFEGTVAANVCEHGTGALNIDACRVATDWNEPDRPESWKASGYTAQPDAEKIAAPPGQGIECHPKGRWPANAVFSHAEECREVGTRNVISRQCGSEKVGRAIGFNGSLPNSEYANPTQTRNGTKYMADETVTAWECVEGCPVAELDRQSGDRRNGGQNATSDRTTCSWEGGASERAPTAYAGVSGGASRFYFCAKPSTAEREAGCEHLPKRSAAELVDREEGSAGISPRAGAGRSSSGRANHHPTVKSIDLMRYWLRLVTPPKGIALDLFAGSGTTGCAAVLEGFRFIGCEKDEGENGEPAGYVEIARARIAHWEMGGRKKTKASPVPEAQASLFDSIGGGK